MDFGNSQKAQLIINKDYHMLKKNLLLLGVFLGLLLFFACESSPSPNTGASPAEAMAAAQAALDRMDGKQPSTAGNNLTSNPAAGNAAVPASGGGAVVNTSRTKPAWVDSVESVYGRAQYVAAVGNAADRTMAERNALANLTAIFGQSIYADQKITNTYQEAVKNGVTTGWTDNTAMQNTIRTTTSMDTLVGAEIKEVWFDSRNTYYAVAVMEKAKTSQLYNEMISANQNVIDNLITMNQIQKNSLEGFSRYQFAAIVADINMTYGNVLQVIGSPLPQGLVKGDNYRIEAVNITKSIPVGIRVRNDKSGRVEGAFAKSLSDLGFRSGGNNSLYILDVNIVTSAVEFPNNTNKFTRIEVDARLTEDGITLLPYNFADREGHATQSEADNRAYMLAERSIQAAYPKILGDYLSQLLPIRR
jgi:hypothetical protein